MQTRVPENFRSCRWGKFLLSIVSDYTFKNSLIKIIEILGTKCLGDDSKDGSI